MEQRDAMVMRMRSVCGWMTRRGGATLGRAAATLVAATILILAEAGDLRAAGGDLLDQFGIASSGPQQPTAATVDSAGNTVIVGVTGAPTDMRVVKVKADLSDVFWPANPDHQIDLAGAADFAAAVAVDGHDDVIAIGYGWNGTDYDIITAKYDGVTGIQQWRHIFKGSGTANAVATAVAIDAVNNIYVAGTIQGGGGADDILVFKLGPDGSNPDGSPLWTYNYNGLFGGIDTAVAIAAGPDGLALTGRSEQAAADPDPLTLKLNFTGAKVWEKSYVDAGSGQGNAVVMGADGSVIVTGFIHNGANKDLFTAKYAAVDAPPIWVEIESNGGDGFDQEGESLALDPAGDVYVSGSAFGLGSGFDLYTVKYKGAKDAANGQYLWSDAYNSSNGDHDRGRKIMVDPSGGDVFVLGYANNSLSDRDDFITLKYKQESGALLWARLFDGQNLFNASALADRPVGFGMGPDGKLRVAGWSDRGTAGAPNLDDYVILYDAGALNPPTALQAAPLTSTAIRLNWTDNSTNEDGFVLERRIGTTGAWTPISLGANTIQHDDPELLPDTRYYYRVRATSATVGNSPWSPESSARTTVFSFQIPARRFVYGGLDGGEDYVSAIAAGPDGSPVATGYSVSLLGTFDYYTVKLDRATADETWSHRYNDDDNGLDWATDLVVDGNGSALVTGFSYLFGGGDENSNDVFTIAYPVGGPQPEPALPWSWAAQQNGAADDDDRAVAIALSRDGSNQSAVAAYGRNASWNDDIFILKYDATGVRLWASVPFDGGGHDVPTAIAFDPLGDLFVVGRSANGVNNDFFVAKYSGANGELLWRDPTPFAGPGNGEDQALALAVDDAGSLYVAGFGAGSAGNADLYLLKYNGSGDEPAWERNFIGGGGGDDRGVALAVDPINGEIVVAGTALVAPDDHDIILLRYTPAGDLVWTHPVDRPGTDEEASAMEIDASGAVTVVGRSGADAIAVKVDHAGLTIGGSLYDGGYGADAAVAVTVNRYGEAFVGGHETNANGNADYLVFLAEGELLQTPHPLSAQQFYTQVNLTWTDNSLDENGFRVERFVGACADAAADDPGWALRHTADADATTFNDTGLTIGSTFCYRVQAFKNNGESSRWTRQTEAVTGEPDPPTGITGTVQSTTAIEVRWTDHVTGEDGYTLERCAGTGCDFATVTRFDVAGGSGQLTYQDTSICAGQSYRYRVQAYKMGEWATAFVTTGDLNPVAVAAPSGLAVSRAIDDRIELRWSDANADENSFIIERCDNSAVNCTLDSDFTPLGSGVATLGTAALLLRMDEAAWSGVASEVLDSSGAGWHGTAVGGATTLTAGRFERGGLFDGGNDYVTTPLNIDQDATSPGATFAAWVYPTARSGNHFVVSTDNGGNDWGILQAGGLWYVSTGDNLYSTGLSVDFDSWQHVAAVFEPGVGVRFFKNGQVYLVGNISADSSAASLTVGRRGGYNQEYFAGRIDEVTVFSRKLSSAEIGLLYQHGCLRFTDDSVAAGSTYTYRVRAHKEATCPWNSPPSNAREATSAAAAPTELAVSVISSDRVGMSWMDNSGAETGFIIERCTGAGCDFSTRTSFTVGAGVRTFTDTTTCAGQSYNYRVLAERSAAWTSPPTPPAAAATPAIPSVSAFTASELTEEQATLGWTFDSTDADGFLLWQCQGACSQQSDFTQIADLPRAPAASLRFPFDEYNWGGAAGEVRDISGNNRHGTAAGGVTTTGAGRYGRAGDFDAGDDAVTTPLNIDQGGTVSVTFEAWVRPTVADYSNRYVISTENGGTDWGIYHYGSTWYVASGENGRSTGLGVDTNQWQHVVAVFDNNQGNIRFYKNGVKAVVPYIGYDSSDNNVTIGRIASANSYLFGGQIDEVAVYGSALTDEEVSGLYQKRTTRDAAGLTPGTTYNWRVWPYKNTLCADTGSLADVSDTTVAPLPPAEFVATPSGSNQVDLSWTNLTTSEEAISLMRCTGTGTVCDEDAEFSPLATLGAGTANFSDATVCAGENYTYRVRAERTSAPPWQTTWSSVATTLPGAATPGSLTLQVLSESQIRVSWTDETVDEGEFVLQRCTGDALACTQDVNFTTVKTIQGTLPGVLAHYKLEETTFSGAGAIIDASGKGNHATMVYTVSPTTEGRFGRGASFTYSNRGRLVTPMVIDQTSTSPGAALEAWIFPTSNGESIQYILSTDNGGSDWGVRRNGGNWQVGTGNGDYNTGATVDFGQWQHIVAVFVPGTGVYFYKNGTQYFVNNIGYDSGTAAVHLGKSPAYEWNYYFDGRMDEVAIYNRPLSAAQVAGHYTDGIQNFTPEQTGLDPSTAYTYRVRAEKDGACNWPSAWAQASTATLAPPAPTDFNTTVISTTRIDLGWTDHSGSETAYHLQRCEVGVDCPAFSDLGALLAANTQAHQDTSACAGKTYRYQVRAEKSDGPVWTTAWVGPAEASTAAAMAPDTLSAVRVSEVRIDLAWLRRTTDETGFKVERCKGPGCTEFQQIAVLPATTVIYQDGELEPDATYRYQVRAYKDATCAWTTAPTNIAEASTSISVPADLSATAAGTTRVDLVWTDNSMTETGFEVERCNGNPCGAAYTSVGTSHPGTNSFADQSACAGQTYTYRLRATDQGLANAGGGCWSRRKPVSFAAFTPNARFEIVIPWQTGMKADFGDIRFYDSAGQRELPYWIEEKTNGVSAVVRVKAGASSAIYLYYGNPDAGDGSQVNQFVEYSETFPGAVINTSRWLEFDTAGFESVAQNNGLQLVDGGADSWARGVISQASFAREEGKEVVFDLEIAADTPGNNHFMVGWMTNQTASASYTTLAHALYFNNYSLGIFEKGSDRGSSGSYSQNTGYQVKIVLKATGARYYIRGGAFPTWNLRMDLANFTDTPLRLGVSQYSHQAVVRVISVRLPLTSMGATLGAEATAACYGFQNTWTSSYSNEAFATTATPLAPTGLSATAVSDTEIHLDWTGNTADADGYDIERCSDSGCDTFAPVTTILGTTTYTDPGLLPSQAYRYQVRAVRNSPCPWQSGYSGSAGATTLPATVGELTATPENSRVIRLDWSDLSSDEDGYKIEVQIANGRFVEIDEVGPNVITYRDTRGLDPGKRYRYQIRGFRGGEYAPYSNVAEAVTPAFSAGDKPCP